MTARHVRPSMEGALIAWLLPAGAAVGAALATVLATVLATGPAADSATTAGEGPDICLRVDTEALGTRDWPVLVAAVDEAMAARPTLFPDRTLVAIPDALALPAPPGAGGWRLGVWSTGAGGRGPQASRDASLAVASCGPEDTPWSASLAGAFLRSGTRRELAAAPTTPGFESSIDVEWYAGEQRVRTVLRFSGPLGIPNGTCWMDDLLAVDEAGRATATVTTGFSTSPFGEGVCGRFEDFLPGGGAGAQAIALLPTRVALPDGTILRFEASALDVTIQGIELAGSLQRR